MILSVLISDFLKLYFFWQKFKFFNLLACLTVIAVISAKIYKILFRNARGRGGVEIRTIEFLSIAMFLFEK